MVNLLHGKEAAWCVRSKQDVSFKDLKHSLRPIHALSLHTFEKCDIILKGKSVAHFVLCRAPGEFCYVANIITVCHVMRLNSVNIAMTIVLTEFPCWYSIIRVKYGYWGDNWTLLPKHKSKTLRHSFILPSNTYQMCRAVQHKLALSCVWLV